MYELLGSDYSFNDFLFVICDKKRKGSRRAPTKCKHFKISGRPSHKKRKTKNNSTQSKLVWNKDNLGFKKKS